MHDPEFVEWLKKCQFTILSKTIDNKFYVFKSFYKFNQWDLLFSLKVKIQDENESKESIGWIVEFRLNSLSYESWETTKKLYETKDVALHAIIQMQRCYSNYDWRVKPVYVFDKQTWRDYALYQILN